MIVFKLILSTVVGAVLLSLSYYAAWYLTPDHCSVLPEFISSEAVTEALAANIDGSGIYVMPSPCALDQDSAPYFFSSIRTKGHRVLSWQNFGTLFYVSFIGTFSLSLILLMSKGVNFGTRLVTLLLIVVFSGIVGFFPTWNWNGFPLFYVTMRTIGLFFSWLLACLAMAALTGRRQETV